MNTSGCPQKSLQVSHADTNWKGVTLSPHCASFSRLTASTDTILLSRIGVPRMNSSPVMLQKQSRTESCSTSLLFYHIMTLIYLQKYGVRHKPEVLLGMLSGWSKLSAEKKEPATALHGMVSAENGETQQKTASHGMVSSLGMWKLAGVQSQGQGGAEGVQGRFLLCFSCSSQRDELCVQRHGDGENLFITNM